MPTEFICEKDTWYFTMVCPGADANKLLLLPSPVTVRILR